MAYRNKTYVIFDGDKDMWAYAYMLGWVKNERMEFNFFDAHDLKEISDRAGEIAIKRILKERLNNTKQAIVLVGDSTRYLYKFVRWEIETCLDMRIPMVVVNLNNNRRMDHERCPPIIKGTASVHVAFRARIIQQALDGFCENFAKYADQKDLSYNDDVYKRLGID
jgi:hypothetical protein